MRSAVRLGAAAQYEALGVALCVGVLLLAACEDSSRNVPSAGPGVPDAAGSGGAKGEVEELAGAGGSSGAVDSREPDGGQAGSSDEPGGRDAGQPNLGPPGIRGILTGESAEPLPNKVVLACMSTVCLFGKTGAGGRFEFQIQGPAEVALKTPEDFDATPRLGAFLMPLVIEGSLVDVGSVQVPNMPAGVPLDPTAENPQPLEVGDGLALTVSRAALTPHLGDRLNDIAARQIPLSRVRAIPGMEGERLVAVYALHPFAATSTRPIAVRAPAALPDGTPVMFRSISEIDGRLSAPAHGVVLDGEANTASEEGVTELTWLVISQ